MSRVIECLTHQHEPWLASLSALICGLGAVATMLMVLRTREAAGPSRLAWLSASAFVAGFTVFSMHFIAMLAFVPGVPIGHDPGLAVLSLVVAIGAMGLALSLALEARLPQAALIGGAIAGAGSAAMHYTGMSAMHVPGAVLWDGQLVAASVFWSMAFTAFSFHCGLRAYRWQEHAMAAVWFAVAVVGLHFIGMGAIEIVYDPTASFPKDDLLGGLPGRLAAIGSCIFLLAFAALDIARQRRLVMAEATHMRELADASLDGLVVTTDGKIVEANLAFERMIGIERSMIIGRDLENFAGNLPIPDSFAADISVPIESTIRSQEGSELPVEIIRRPITFACRPSIAAVFRDLTPRRKAEADIRFLAYHDSLTGLPNRTTFKTKLEQKLLLRNSSSPGMAVMALDLDGFKAVNDTLGHSMGDTLLREIGKRLQEAVREPNLVARLGGDEFAVLVPDVSRDGAAAFARIVIDTIGKPYVINDHVLNVGSSVGIALAPKDGTEAGELLKKADLGMYRSKAEGRGTHHFYEDEMDAQMRQRHALEIDLHNAVAYQQFELYYQPLLSVKTGKISGCEALVRWRHPTRGLVSPADFIPLAEETGLIVQMGEWVIQTACQQATRWIDGQSVAVNLSPVQFRSPHLIDMVATALEVSGLEPSRLWLEITESVFLADNASVIATLHRLKALGVRISLDDFGTGYSSLNYLRAFPFDKMKIDRSFISQVGESHESGAIVHAVVGLGHSLKIVTTAEGVETQAQFAHMEAEGCDEIQGYYVSRPVPASDIATLLIARNATTTTAAA